MPERTSAKPVVLVASDGVVPTGFARVAEAIFTRLADEFDIHHLAIGHCGDPHHLPWPVYPAGIEPTDRWGLHRIAHLCDWLRPDVVFMLNDTWIVGKWLTALATATHQPPCVAYVPVDAGPVDPRSLDHFGRLHRVVAYTETSKACMEEAFAQRRAIDPGFVAPEVGVVPHGNDGTRFHHLGEGHRAAARAEIFADNPELQAAFIVLNANRNQPRKRIDVTIRGFAEFACDKPPDVKLFLHMGCRDLGWDIPDLVRRFGIDDRVLMSTDQPNMPGVSDHHLNLIYNACDVGVNTSEAEGWGLVAFEHAATGAAQIMPDHATLREIWGEAAHRLPIRHTLVEHGTSTDVGLVAAADLTDALDRIYADPALRRDMSQRAYAHANQPTLSWDAIAETWRTTLREACQAPVAR